MPATVLVGLIGAGIQKSLTPAMHEQEGAAQGIPYIYKLIDLDKLGLSASALPDLLIAAERMGFSGLNITYPCKQAVVPLLDDLSREARELGAVNTVVFQDGRRIGHNTDWWGFAEAFKRNLADVVVRCVALLGAGGAGCAVAHALLTLGVRELIVVDTDADKASELVQSLQKRFGSGRAIVGMAKDAMARADGLVNATPIGMAKLPGMALEPSLLRASQWVADIIYFPMETELLRRARDIGCRTMSGGGMAVFQAVEAFRLLSGRPANHERMQAHFKELCGASA
jgi:shikimate dehydrogenase